MSSSEENSLNPPCEYQDNLNLLRQTYFFGGLPLEVLKVFAYLCLREKYKSGDYLFRQGEDDGNAFCLISGRARIERQSGEESRVVRVVGPGQFIGGLTLLGPTSRLYSLGAVDDTVSIVLSREKFSKTIQQFPEQMPRIFKAVVSAVNAWEQLFLEQLGPECNGCLPNLGVTLL
jgi:CRP/FNR family transcriptional regulator, cyclic AMP receptor protein